MRACIAIVCIWILASASAWSQRTDLNSKHPPANRTSIAVEKIADDSLSTSFLIWIEEGVKRHFHTSHTEHVTILEGTGEMELGDSLFTVKPGDFLLIPRGTPHAVVAITPMKVLSIQTPRWTTEDRVFLPVMRRN